MSELSLFDGLLAGWFALAAVTFIALFFISAPYGRHARKGWGPLLPNWLGWLIMEAPSALAFGVYFFIGPHNTTLTEKLLFTLWEVHYIHRAFIYPFTLRGRGKRMPVSVVVLAMVFNLGNTYLNGRYLFSLSGGYAEAWLRDPRFLVGFVLFVAGFLVNRQSDQVLRHLRRPGGEDGYKIPFGGLYRWVSCPNYLGEIMEWTGWALATWSLSGLAFAVWTLANLTPRARDHHYWYQATFEDYPPERKALLPGIW